MSLSKLPESSPGQMIYLISDLHLQASHPLTMKRFQQFMAEEAPQARALYLLGDIFEAWPGDDDAADPFNALVAQTIRTVASQGVPVFWMAGNRDFLVGQQFAGLAGMTLLEEPQVLDIGGQRIALVHGDAQCTDDLPYMAFRAQVRNPQWQQQFLQLPLAQRKAMVADARKESTAGNQKKEYAIMDVNAAAIETLFRETRATAVIHGHTHRPARHQLQVDGRQCVRYVLPDWESDSPQDSERGGWMTISENGDICMTTLTD